MEERRHVRNTGGTMAESSTIRSERRSHRLWPAFSLGTPLNAQPRVLIEKTKLKNEIYTGRIGITLKIHSLVCVLSSL